MRRALSLAGSILVAAVVVVGVLLFFAARDQSNIDARGAVGEAYRGEPVLSPALQDAVADGNVVVLHRDPRPPRGTRSLQDGAGPRLASVGLAVLLEREPTLDAPLAAVSEERILQAERPEDLQEFVDFHLGRAGAP